VTGGPFRIASGGRVDRSAPIGFTFDGTAYQGFAGDTLASALLANGVRVVARSVTLGRPRGIVSAGSEEPSAVVQVEAPFPEPMLPATTIELYDGLVASSLSGRGRLAAEPDPARYDTMHAHCDVLVVGAGPAGLAAARAAASGARVILADEQPGPGGSLLGGTDLIDGSPAQDWIDAASKELRAAPEVRVLPRTTVFGYYHDNYLVAVERRTAHLGLAAPAGVSRERVWRIRANRVVLATGAHERSIAFPDNDRPGVMLAGAVRTYVNRYAVLPGRRGVVFTTNDSAYATAFDLVAAGAEVAAVVDARPDPGDWGRKAREAGLTVLAGHQVVAVHGEPQVNSVGVAAVVDGASVQEQVLEADLLAVSGGWNPVVHLYSQAGGRLRADADHGTFVPDGCAQAVEVVGAVAEAVPVPVNLWVVPAGSGGPDTRFVDLQRDVTVSDLLRATGAGLRSVEHVKRYTTAGTAHDQGKTSGVLAAGVLAQTLGVPLGELGTTTFRPPYGPVGFATLAGRDRGALHDPVRVTPIHSWHVDRGAPFENVGQWKRAWYYPEPGEDMTTAVLRECRAAREGVAFMDASTLGKIDVQGDDAGEFLDRLYTNMISTLKPGAIRYGVLCRADGMVFDDGTVIRLAADRFLTTTTTGNAAAVLDWMEEWLQTEWPQLDVRLTSVTDHWATIALVGPRSREVLAGLAPDLDVSVEAFPFMTWRDTVVAGLAARVCRISFSGELAYEINVRGWDGLRLWEAVYAAGGPLGITPYGTETMHVLRAEKGYPIIGQDTDGTVTPQDLGMGWVVSKKKPDFVGKRSHLRIDTSRTDRKHLVALLPQDPAVLLPEGSHVITTATVPRPPVPMLGHVTSSYHSAALHRTFALALVRGGRDRLGERLYVPVDGVPVPVEVAGPVLYDPQGARRDG
jgi:sarcosine oxidase subunit alpha